ncbi:hypothetical protein F4805DRAFT_453436 [Annulohypoxylon moriforme]|nr:hypothetical protein F4805DRAFT_453436 [Annulohypoxylon moriforme]
MVFLTELPPEIVQHVLGYVDPPDLAWIPRICKSFYHTVKGNASLFRAVYLNHYDNPSKSDIDWEQALKNAVRLQVICRQEDAHNKKHELPFVYDTVKALLENAATDTERVRQTTHPASRNAKLLSSIFKDETNQSAFLCRSYIYERARQEHRSGSYSEPQPDHQKSAHLHCLYGVPMLYAHPEAQHRTRHSKMSPYACSKVYDLRQYTENTKWGPFFDDTTDRVDWEKVEAIMIVIGSNLRKLGLTKFPVCKNFWELPFAGTWPGSYKALPVAHEPEPLDLRDPYGITGTWLRVVCFLDYTDFFAYNFTAEDQLTDDVPRPPIDVGEATRLILMKIRATRIEPPGPDDGQELPVVHFEGISRSLDDSYDENANSDLTAKGSVRLTREGEVRWTTFSVFNGVERWRSESVQVGGVKSAKGVLGNWFDKDFDPRGPAGPTAFWKVSDKVMESGGYRALMQDFLPLIQDGPDETTDFENGQIVDDEEEEDSDEPGLELEITGISFVTWTDD